MNQVVSNFVQRSAIAARQPVLDVKRQLRLLCATDLSRRSDRAMLRAMLLAQELGAELLLFHSIDAAPAERVTRRKRTRAQIILDARARRMLPSGTVPQTAVRVGGYRNAIAEMAKEWEADLIILGSHTARLGDSIVATTAESLIRKVHRPVLVVKRDARSAYQHVLLTSDLTDVSAGAARLAQNFGLLEGRETSVVHALASAATSMLRMSGVGKAQVESYERQFRQWTAEEIMQQLQRAGLSTDGMSIVAEQGAPASVIERVSELTAADLVVVGASRFPALKRVVLGSVSNEVLRRLACDVLLVSPGAIKHERERTREDVNHAWLAHDTDGSAMPSGTSIN
jgi:nucleotide-binding universal stress UspA family protein